MIREYREGEHPSGFIGIRVAVHIAGEINQRYYNFRSYGTKRMFITKREEKELWSRAKALYLEWTKQRIQAEIDRRMRPVLRKGETKPSIYGIRVITDVAHKRGVPHVNYTLCMNVRIDGETYVKTHSIKDSYEDYLKYWTEVARYLVKLRGRKRIPSTWKKTVLTEEEYNKKKKAIIAKVKKLKQEKK